MYMYILLLITPLAPHAKGNAQGLSRTMQILNTHFEICGVPKINTQNLYDASKTSRRNPPVLQRMHFWKQTHAQNQNLKDTLGLHGYTLAPGPGPVAPWALGLHSFRSNFMQVCLELNALFTELTGSHKPREVAQSFELFAE